MMRVWIVYDTQGKPRYCAWLFRRGPGGSGHRTDESRSARTLAALRRKLPPGFYPEPALDAGLDNLDHDGCPMIAVEVWIEGKGKR